MSSIRHVAVIDVGKTNAKVGLVDVATLQEIIVETRPNTVHPGPPWPHFDLDGLWDFFSDCLSRFHLDHGVDAISVTTHGASAVLLADDGSLAAPMLDYEFEGPDAVRDDYDRIRPRFEETGSPRLGRGLNLGAQLHWQLSVDPGLGHRIAHVLTYPQYWGFRFTGNLACDVSSLGCHTDLWNPWAGTYSTLVARMGLTDKMAPARRPSETLGPVRPGLCRRLGLRPGTPVSVGIHDSNASLLPHLKGREPPFSVVSTGTWVIAMAIGGDPVDLPPERDTLVNVNAFGDPVPSARFMGGREFEDICGASPVPSTDAELSRVVEGDIMLLPAVEAGSGPFQGQAARWTSEPQTDRERYAAASCYLALMTETCLRLVGAAGPTIVEGPLAGNAPYLSMLSTLRAEPVETTRSLTGTSIGAALLAVAGASAPATHLARVTGPDGLACYARTWFRRAERPPLPK